MENKNNRKKKGGRYERKEKKEEKEKKQGLYLNSTHKIMDMSSGIKIMPFYS